MSNYIIEKQNCIEQVVKIKKIAEEHNYKNVISKSNFLIKQLESDTFIITVVGEFNRGKSTLLNAILGVDIIPTSIRPTTATINIIHYAEKPSLRVFKKNGEIIEIEFNKKKFEEFSALRNFDAQTVKYVEIAYPIDYLKDGIVLVDTPGIEDIEQQRVDITYGYMPVSDATILLLDATAPLRNSEKNFLTEQVFHSNIPTIFFVINQIDKISDSELERINNDIENKLKKIIELDRYNGSVSKVNINLQNYQSFKIKFYLK
ncbi:dynamin family protein [Candidatus Dependentiae bacterium]|nr:dynamin family protein [Candidatus Dependentiae bacterium]